MATEAETDVNGGYRNFAIERTGHVAVVRIDRPEKHNAMARDFWPELRSVLTELEDGGRIRSVVLVGTGDRAFSAGGDIETFAELTGEDARREFQIDCMRTFAAVEESPLAIVAAVNGWALGGGCELALASDMVLAAENAVFGLPETAIGLVPGFGVLRAPSVVGRHWAKYMVLAGEHLSAEDAQQAGMVQRVLPAGELLRASIALAEKIAERAPLATSAAKKLINRGIGDGDASESVDVVTGLHAANDTAEGVRAFLERRPPTFHGN